MSDQSRTLDLLRRAPDRKRLPVATEDRADGLEALGATAPTASGSAPFSVFIPEHQERALELAAQLMERSRQDGLPAALDLAEAAAEEVSVELAQYALMVFATHDPRGRSLPIPALEERSPAMVRPTGQPRSGGQLEALGATGDEAALDWYREDADANGHHERWHVVYPARGIPDPNNPFGPRITKDRQGELFLYMHQQMLARYDAERLGAGLGKSEPLFDYEAILPEGYDPEMPFFDARPADTLMADSTEFSPTVLTTWAERLFGDVLQADATLTVAGGGAVPATPDTIGHTVEANAASVNPQHYGSLHNMGHVTIAFIPDPASAGHQNGGVMLSTATAIRDPIFYRWHRHIDDLLFEWQELQGEQSFDDAPPVLLRNGLEPVAGEEGSDGEDGASPDVFVILDKVLPGGEAQALADEQFGGDRWDRDPADSALVAEELVTTMRTRHLPDGTEVQVLDHPDFHHVLRVENPTDATLRVTVRLFLVPEEWAEERRHWIELDKFQHDLAAGRNVITRSSRLSSVVKKPARRPGDPPAPVHPGDDPNYCDCGWPYHLLLPRGTEAGMPCRLLAVLTDWEHDRVAEEGTCGSMSFCGKRDVAYPDRRPMGYPFDRPWPGGDLSSTIRQLGSMASRRVVLRAEAGH